MQHLLKFAAVGALSLVVAAQEPPPDTARRFRSGVDVVLVDVSVIDDAGRQITNLTAGDFNVSIGGKRRTVVFAEFLQHGASGGAVRERPFDAPGASEATRQPLMALPRRVFVLAIDALSFSVGSSRGVAVAAESFVAGLQKGDLVGLFTYPLGPKVDPTTDHPAVIAALKDVTGQRGSVGFGELRLTPSEIVDFSSRGGRGGSSCPYTFDCRLEAASAAAQFEGMATVSLNMLRSLLVALRPVEDTKIVVLVSAGMVMSDRPGSRPDVGDLGIEVGREAARSNVSIYTLFIDHSWLDRYAAEVPGAGRARTVAQARNQARDGEVLRRWLDQFTGTAGGVLLPVRVGSGEIAFDRILRETAGLYVLGVQLEGSDRNGQVHDLTVRTRRSGATVRSRRWIAVPAPEQ